MFDTLTDRLGNIFGRLRSRGKLSESDINAIITLVTITGFVISIVTNRIPVDVALLSDIPRKPIFKLILLH